jgi:hypothetical protein
MRRWLALPLLFTMAACTEPAPARVGGRPPILPIGGDGGTTCAHPSEGCACAAGQPPIDCYLDAITNDDGSLTCNGGTRYCRDGLWTGCESIRQYTIEASPTALISGPDQCNPCDPHCYVSTDTPTPGDLTAANSSAVTYDALRGGITLTATPSTVAPLPDTDGDGVPDLADHCPGVAGSVLNADATCYTGPTIYHELPWGALAWDVLDAVVEVQSADVYFLIDTTSTMAGELGRLQADLTSGTFGATGCSGGILGGIRCTIPGAWFGVGSFDDFPVSPYGTAGTDAVYRNALDIGESLTAPQTAISALAIHAGGDTADASTQALYAVASGSGLSTYLGARAGCAAGTWGYPCFRDASIPIIVHLTDATLHNGPADVNPYCIGGSSGGLPTPTAITTITHEAMDATAYPVGSITGSWVGFSGSTSGMSDNVASGCGVSGNDRDAVFRVTVATTGVYRISLEGSSFDTVLGVVPVGSSVITCNDNATTSVTYSQLDLTLAAGDYYVIVDGKSSTANGAYQLSVGQPSCTGYSGASYASAVAALGAQGARVITVQTCGDWSDATCLEAETQARALASSTGSLDSSGTAMVYRGNADGSGIATTIVDAVAAIATDTRMDVSANIVGDTAGFTWSPVWAWWWDGTTGTCTGITADTLTGCTSGTSVHFFAVFHNDVVTATLSPQLFEFSIEIVGDGTTVLATIPVQIIVPAVPIQYPIAGTYWRDHDTTTRCDPVTEGPQWGDLTWTADTPTGTQIQFELRAATTAAGLDTATGVARVTVPSSSSPVDVAAALRSAGYADGMPFLRVSAVLRSDSLQQTTPSLSTMSVDYTCIPIM